MSNKKNNLEESFRESDYLRDGNKTTLSDVWLKKISIKMDKKRESRVTDSYLHQASKTKINVATDIMKSIDVVMWSDLMKEKRSIEISPNQVVEAIVPHKNHPVVINAKKGISDDQLNFLIEVIGRKVTNKKMSYKKYNWNALSEMVDKIFKP